MPNDNQTLSPLRNIIIRSVKQPVIDNIPQLFQFLKNRVEVRLASVKQTAHILKEKYVRVQSANRFDEHWEPIPNIVQSVLISDDTEGLARRTANQDTCRWQFRLGGERHRDTLALEVFFIGCAACGIHFVTARLESLGFES